MENFIFVILQPENSRFQGFIYDIIQHLYFKRFIAMLVLANSFLLSIKWEPEDDDQTERNMTSGSQSEMEGIINSYFEMC